MDEARSNQEAKNGTLAGAFSDYADKQGVLLGPDDALTALAQFITDNKVPLLLEQDLPDSPLGRSSLDRRISRLVAAFITEEADVTPEPRPKLMLGCGFGRNHQGGGQNE